MISLSERQKKYEAVYDSEITRRIPIIIRCDGVSFTRLTKRIEKPYSQVFSNIMAQTMLSVAKVMDGCVFAYQQSDEITFILRNDRELETQPWYDNRIQKIASVSAALVTKEFDKALALSKSKLDLAGDAMFDARVFAVPSLHEAINNLIFRQKDCLRNAISSATKVELRKTNDIKTTVTILNGKNKAQQLEILTSAGIDFFSHYPLSFQKGIAAAKAPKILNTEHGQITRHKWTLDNDPPEFQYNKEYVRGILNLGRDVFRAKRDMGDSWVAKI